ncbi:MAG: prenyltransferase/squalene oxidase repeat-containing protein [Planctomycetota bacterium]|jgi:hypothetical protein
MKYCAVVLALLAGTARAGEELETERIKLVRTAIEARLKLGDALREKGDLAGALKAYREAAGIYDRSQGLRAKGAADVNEIEEIVEEPIEQVRVRTADVRKAIDGALTWLSMHQDDDGKWDADGFMKHDPANDRTDGSGGKFHDVGVTSLALLAFLEAGHTSTKGPYREPVGRGLEYLIRSLDTEGCFGSRATQHFMYNTALATRAMCLAARLTGNAKYRRHAQDAANFIAKARNPYMAWRYEPRGGENDTSVTVFCVKALREAQAAGLKVDPGYTAGARQWIDKMTDPDFGQVGYNMRGGSPARMEGMQDKFPPERSQAMTAAGLLVRILCGEDPRKSDAIGKGTRLCQAVLPRWDMTAGTIDMYYWHLGTGAMFEVGGADWKRWNLTLRTALVPHQHKQGAREGSWDPVGAWGGVGGRVYATSINALTLLESLRAGHTRVFGAKR